jgi:hypothetical protein
MEIRYVYLNDGTEIEDDEVLMSLEAGTVLHLETFPTSSTTAVKVSFCVLTLTYVHACACHQIMICMQADNFSLGLYVQTIPVSGNVTSDHRDYR